MTTEQLTTGKELSSEIEGYKSHIKRVEDLLTGNGTKFNTNAPLQLNAWRNDYKDEIYLKWEHIHMNEFLSLYLMRAKQKLAELESKFEKL